MTFDYFYGHEDAEQFLFYRIPKTLIMGEDFREVSVEAKLLYGLMLDRLSLSMKNGWFDDLNRAYIVYTVEDIIPASEAKAEETAETPEPTKEPEKETTQPSAETVEKKQNVSLFAAAGVLIIVIGGIAIWIFLQAKKKKKPANQPDPDADYREDEDGYDLPEEEDPEEDLESEDE